MSRALEGTRVLVTGASRGIGTAICESLAAEGARLVVSARDLAALEQLAAQLTAEHGVEIRCVPADLADPRAASALAMEAWAAFGGLDVLVNNAGLSITGPAAAMTRDDWDTVMAVNLHSPAMLAADLGGRMADAGGGRIVTIGSAAALRALPEHYAYCASKAALVMATKVLALELGPRGVRANSICPTVVLTEMGTQVWGEEAKAAPMLARIPAGHFALPADVAAAVLYLASPGAEMVNGTDLVLDGGYLAT
jgi:NAD(P)-dependent dehydrogenase (short-subunit alcohol dehydrogenase family)